MARKRYLKPGFFRNEELASLPPLVRILFQGLWCYADREGRLEDRPTRLKADILPYDNIKIDSALNKLQEKEFIIRYKISDGKNDQSYIQIIKFKTHQDVHINEQASTIPAPVLHGASTVQVSAEHGGSTPLTLTYTLNPNLLEEEVVDGEPEKKEDYTFDDAVKDFKNQSTLEKEKSSAKKEILTPAQAIEKIVNSGTAWWKNVIEHQLKPPKTQLTPELMAGMENERTDLFIIFYETKEDNYKIRYPTFTDMAQNFYYWVGIQKQKSNIQQLQNGSAKTNSKPVNKSRSAANEDRGDIAAKSADFLSKLAG